MTREEQKYHSLRERFNTIASVQNKISLIYDLRHIYGGDMTLQELEEQLWAEKKRLEEEAKRELFM